MGDTEKKWGHNNFWGLGSYFDNDWVLTDEQKELQTKLIELCRTTIRPNAAKCDKEYIFPRESLDSLASLGLFGLVVPKDLGGMGQTHVCFTMVVETIARYGCPSTALVYTMHVLSSAMCLFGVANNPTIKDILRNINKKKLLMTSAHSDPATGGHFWYPFTSKVKELDDDTIRLFKYGSWVTSSGYADVYLVCTTSPGFKGDYSDMTVTVCFKNEVRAFTQDWNALGMHGNMSSEMVVDAKIPKDRVISNFGHGGMCNDECAAPFFNIGTAACWNGISMACLDLAKKYVTRKSHGDVGMRICDYSTIQTYFGQSICSTTTTRLSTYALAKRLDQVTNNNDLSLIFKKPFDLRRKDLIMLIIQIKHETAANANTVSDTMLQACGGVGYKSELGLERLFRDAKAGQLMAISNEVVRILVGKMALMGPESLDLWQNVPNKRLINHEVTKMSTDEKKKLAQTLLKEVEEEEKPSKAVESNDFDNPFNLSPPTYMGEKKDSSFSPALDPTDWQSLVLRSSKILDSKTSAFEFSLPEGADHSGLIAGQYIKAKVSTKDNGTHERYFSPVSIPSDPQKIELVLRFESHGIVSEHFQNLKKGSTVEFQGPCGGFEYSSNALEELTLLTAGGAVTPALQIVRTIVNDPKDKTRCNLIYYSNTYEEILFKDELEKYNEDSRINICFTVGEAPPSWSGEEGFIDETMIGKYVSKNDTPKHKIVLCGGVNMCLTCCHALRALGFKSSQVFVYGHFGAEVVRSVFGRSAELSSHSCAQ